MFPESFWPPVKNSDYIKTILNGRHIGFLEKILFCGITRNSPIAVSNINQLLYNFPSSKIVVYENDSTDLISQLAKQYNTPDLEPCIIHKYEDLGHEILKQDRSLLRRTRMAYYRNQALEMAREVMEGFSYLAVVDLDLLGGYSIEGIYSSLHFMQCSKTIIGSNGIIYKEDKRLYYDSWALRENTWEVLDDPYVNTKIFNRGEPPIRVKSCFGGLCLYPISVLHTNARYESWDCDHVTYHKQLEELGYSVYLNPSQITLYSENYYRV